jgi:transposase-like protein
MEAKMLTTKCPLCDEALEIGMILKLRQRLHCPACQAVLEAVSLNPIKLDWLYFDQFAVEENVHAIEKKSVAECPICRNEFQTPSRLRIGQCILCPACDVELEVVWLSPVELIWPYGEGFHHLGNEYQGDVDLIAGDV